MVQSESPYQTSSTVNDQPDDVQRPRRALWIAYAFSPAIAPIAFVVLLFLLGAICTALNFEVNPASFLVLPVLALTVGMVTCYLVAGAIGMPIAFYFHRRQSLTGYTIHGAALCWSIFVSFVVGAPMVLTGITCR